MIFGRGRARSEGYNFMCKNENIEVVEEYKCLGVLLSNNGRFRRGQQECIEAPQELCIT